MPRYLLLVPVPTWVENRGAIYDLEIRHVLGSGHYRLIADHLTGEWPLAEHASEARLTEELYKTGFDVPARTVPAGIMEQLRRDGRARLIRS